MRTIIFFALLPLLLFGEESFVLKENLSRVKKGDYVVIVQGRCYTLFHIFSKKKDKLVVEEISIPSSLASIEVSSWPLWVESGAPQNTSWIHYQVDLGKGKIVQFFSFTKNSWFTVPEEEQFLSILLNLPLQKIPEGLRKRVGSKKGGAIWQPKMVVNGKIIEGVPFDAYEGVWPNDGGPLSLKTVEVYLPLDRDSYAGYFPYWLGVKGVLGPSKVRIVDSGRDLKSPAREVINISE